MPTTRPLHRRLHRTARIQTTPDAHSASEEPQAPDALDRGCPRPHRSRSQVRPPPPRSLALNPGLTRSPAGRAPLPLSSQLTRRSARQNSPKPRRKNPAAAPRPVAATAPTTSPPPLRAHPPPPTRPPPRAPTPPTRARTEAILVLAPGPDRVPARTRLAPHLPAVRVPRPPVVAATAPPAALLPGPHPAARSRPSRGSAFGGGPSIRSVPGPGRGRCPGRRRRVRWALRAGGLAVSARTRATGGETFVPRARSARRRRSADDSEEAT